MSLTEFNAIDRFWKRASRRPQTVLSIGDDGALLANAPGQHWALTVDTLVAGVHFLPDTDAFDLGHKMLAVNLSDLAAMGAQPMAVTLALTLPKLDEAWLARLAEGFWQLAETFEIDLIGGDTTQGPLTATLQAMGQVPAGQALTRRGAKPGDGIYVTGTLGDAGLGLNMLLGKTALACPDAVLRHHRPTPRVHEGLALRGIANSCIDISDGLAQDLGHILRHSGVGATLHEANLPLSPSVKHYIQESGDWQLPLTAGEDYELCCTLPPKLAQHLPNSFTCIGTIDTEPGLRIQRGTAIVPLSPQGYQHFS
ncbi:MAG: thiamine-phosphate kinase [Methylococcales bacterium]|nr:thiamine-phosphate kinase [Methylococcales bacterium]